MVDELDPSTWRPMSLNLKSLFPGKPAGYRYLPFAFLVIFAILSFATLPYPQGPREEVGRALAIHIATCVALILVV